MDFDNGDKMCLSDAANVYWNNSFHFVGQVD